MSRQALKDGFAGLGLGGLFGVLLGLSVAQAVGAVIAALAAVLAAFFGLSDKAAAGSPVRLASFGLAAIAGIMLGIALRAQDRLSHSPLELVERWQAAGFPAEEARSIVAFERLGIRPQGREVGALPLAGRSTVLFSGAGSGDCQRLASISDPLELLAQFHNLGGTWRTVGEGLREHPQAATAVAELVCGAR